MSEKNLEPTEKRLRDAREKGQVGISRDVAKAASLGVLGEIAFGTESLWRGKIELLMSLPMQRVGQPFGSVLMEMSSAAVTLLFASFAILGLAGIVVAVFAFWGQIGVLISPKALAPKFESLNPVQGVKNLFSKKKLIELLSAIIKAAIIAMVMYLFTKSQLPSIVGLANGTPKDSYSGFIELLHGAFRLVLVVSIVFALVDLVVQKRMHKKSLFMSMDEIKREYRESEGDPMVKGMRRQLAMELASSGPVAKTAEADAVVVNPTHFAVAMQYDPVKRKVPIVLAKGKDETALAMIARARELGIPVIRHVWLARTLYATGRADCAVPRNSFEAVAHVYAVIQELGASCAGETIELESVGDPATD